MAMTSTEPLASERQNPPARAPYNPVRISRIGSDHLEVFIRRVDGCGELLALVDRLEQLIGAGYDTIDVVFDAAHHSRPAGPAEPSADRTGAAPRRDRA